MGKKIDESGKRFGKLTVIKENPNRSNDGRVMWDCVCDCGNLTTIRGKHLRSGHTQSCGCYKIVKTKEHFSTHGKTGSKVLQYMV